MKYENTFKGSRWDRYLGMTAAMTQVPVPTAKAHEVIGQSGKNKHFLLLFVSLTGKADNN